MPLLGPKCSGRVEGTQAVCLGVLEYKRRGGRLLFVREGERVICAEGAIVRDVLSLTHDNMSKMSARK